MFSDVGYRSRMNIFHNHKYYYPFSEYTHEGIFPEIFYDWTYYNLDTYEVEPSNQKLLAEIYFRMEVD